MCRGLNNSRLSTVHWSSFGPFDKSPCDSKDGVPIAGSVVDSSRYEFISARDDQRTVRRRRRSLETADTTSSAMAPAERTARIAQNAATLPPDPSKAHLLGMPFTVNPASG
jgi:hypothetical protein